MEPISDRRRAAFMVEVHRAIRAAARDVAAKLASGTPASLTYPPNGGLEPEEVSALEQLTLDPAAQRAMEKVVAEAMAGTAFDLLCLLDAVGDPEGYEASWAPICLAELDPDQDSPMLHDEFYETYQDFLDAHGGD